MTQNIIITAGTVTLNASLNETATAQAIWDALPIEAAINTWGDEIYFNIPLSLAQENEQEVVKLGDLAYWPPGKAFCIFFGSTPMSIGDEIRPASPVTVFGKLEGDVSMLKKVKSGELVKITKK